MKRWRREPNETGLRSICQGTRGWEYRENGEEIATVRPLTRGWDRWDVIGWFFCCGGYNSYAKGVTFKTDEEAKAAAVEFHKSNPTGQTRPATGEK